MSWILQRLDFWNALSPDFASKKLCVSFKSHQRNVTDKIFDDIKELLFNF